MPTRVLLVEDNPLDQLLVSTVLRKSGYEIETVGDGQAALDRAVAESSFDVFLVDYELPSLNGIQVTAGLRNLGFRQPILAFSAGSEADLIERWRDAGCCDFLAKPYLPKQLREFVDHYLSRRRTSRAMVFA
ncbi:MAG: response regulator [Blastopirellula sp. JB062]